MEEVFFIDLNGNIISDDHISSHIGLSKKIVQNDEYLKEKFIESGYDKEDIFLLEYIGYTLGSGMPYNRFLIINKEKTTKKQKETQFRFVQEGYAFHFTDEETKTKSI